MDLSWASLARKILPPSDERIATDWLVCSVSEEEVNVVIRVFESSQKGGGAFLTGPCC